MSRSGALSAPGMPLMIFRSPPEFWVCIHIPVVLLWCRLAAGLCLTAQLPSLRSLPLRRIPGNGQLELPGQGFQSLTSVTLSVFLALSGFYSIHYLPALFHAGPAREVSLQGLSPFTDWFTFSGLLPS